jgi:integrase
VIEKKRHKPRRRGSVIQRSPGTWLVRLTIATDPVTGKQYRDSKVIKGTKADAERYLTERLSRTDAGDPTVDVALKRQTLGEWLREYFSTWSGNLAPRTKHKFQENLDLYIPDSLRAVRLSALTATTLQHHFNELSSRVSWSTMSYTHRVLRARLNDAVTHGRIARNPMTQVRLPHKPHSEIRTLTPDEAKRFLAAAEDDRFGALWSLLLLTGLRPAEALGLKWEDWSDGALQIRRSLVRTKTEEGPAWTLEDTKTKRARVVSLPELAVRLLQDQKRKQAAERLAVGPLYVNNDLIFANHVGGPLNLNTEVSRHYKHVLKAAKLGDMRLYDLRHSAATLLLAAGEHPKVVQERLGHSTITLTLDTYSHVQPDMQKRAAERLDDLLSPKRLASRTAN